MGIARQGEPTAGTTETPETLGEVGGGLPVSWNHGTSECLGPSEHPDSSGSSAVMGSSVSPEPSPTPGQLLI